MNRVLSLCICTTSLLAGATLPAVAGIADCPVVRSEQPLQNLEHLFDLRAASPYGSPNEAPYLNNEAMEEDGPADQNLLNIWTQQNPDTPLPVVRFGAAGARPKSSCRAATSCCQSIAGHAFLRRATKRC
ncbi:hypothetical protein [Mesorhizobium huakuii]|uniref:Uncharacterized protein n=1 Tax=Mesorhizobium huakuii TaxID=28104 RepID=A0A7G6SNH5_9HYPH|nr:hypothetical protein [Mesorhizobium huakuii]QND56057.1 hypothetical protein HB778_04935 [Mesorhizobium huakuii]